MCNGANVENLKIRSLVLYYLSSLPLRQVEAAWAGGRHGREVIDKFLPVMAVCLVLEANVSVSPKNKLATLLLSIICRAFSVKMAVPIWLLWRKTICTIFRILLKRMV